jgi:tetratricopeptide (TPR) repeat protein
VFIAKEKMILTLGVAAAVILSQSAPAQEKKWKDRAEYDMVQVITNQATPPAKKLELLQQWEQKYPESDFKIERYQSYITTYQQLGKAPEMLASAKKLTELDPKGVSGPYWITLLTVSMANTAPDALDSGEKAANSLIANLPNAKPANVSDADWNAQKATLESQAYSTLGWISIQRKNFTDAEKHFVSSLKGNPNNGQVAYWLGSAILGQKNPDKQSSALFAFARAAMFDGQNALPEATRKQVSDYLDKIFAQYHGDKSGLDELRAQAKASALPPDGFHIKSFVEIAAEKEEEFKKTNPMLALWIGVKKELTGPNGAAYFESSVKNAALPPLKGKIISFKPAANAKEIVVGVADATTPEITIKIAENGFLKGRAEGGEEIEFESMGLEYSPDPFMLTVEAEKEKIKGWPALAPVVKKAPAGKKAAPKKK